MILKNHCLQTMGTTSLYFKCVICSVLVLNSQIYSTMWNFSHCVYLANESFLSQSDLQSMRSSFISICVNETHDKLLFLKPCIPLYFRMKHHYHCNKDKSVWRVSSAFLCQGCNYRYKLTMHFACDLSGACGS